MVAKTDKFGLIRIRAHEFAFFENGIHIKLLETVSIGFTAYIVSLFGEFVVLGEEHGEDEGFRYF